MFSRVVLALTMFIYACVGKVVYKNHRQFRNLTTTTDNATTTGTATATPNPKNGGGGGGQPVNSKTTEVHITSESALESGFDTPLDSDRDSFGDRSNIEKYPRYAVNIESSIQTPAVNDTQAPQRRTASPADRAAWAYLKCAMLFFFALLITWVSSLYTPLYSPQTNFFPP